LFADLGDAGKVVSPARAWQTGKNIYQQEPRINPKIVKVCHGKQPNRKTHRKEN
jgi:hypothetical protein